MSVVLLAVPTSSFAIHVEVSVLEGTNTLSFHPSAGASVQRTGGDSSPKYVLCRCFANATRGHRLGCIKGTL